MCIQGNPKLREGHGQLETEIDVRRLGAAESIKISANLKKSTLCVKNVQTQRTHGAIITSLLRRNDVATSFRRNNDVIITSCVRWELSGPLYLRRVIKYTHRHQASLSVDNDKAGIVCVCVQLMGDEVTL